jgi:hypothetical protein
MTESNDTRPLPEKGQHHFEWVPDEPLESAIAQAETVYGQRGQAIQSVWAPAKRHGETTRHTLAGGRAIEVYPHPRVPEWHIVVELVGSEEAAGAAGVR